MAKKTQRKGTAENRQEPWKTDEFPAHGHKRAGVSWSAAGAVGGGQGGAPLHMFPENRVKRALGWLPDLPDIRDTTLEGTQERLRLAQHREAKSLYAEVSKSIGSRLTAKANLPGEWNKNEPLCSPIEDQRDLGSCTANAGVGMVEYMENRAAGTYIDASRLFLYKVTRNLLGWTGDTGAFLRTTMKALVLFGAPPERWWPYDDLSTFDDEPDAFLYAFAANYKTIQYMRLDAPGTSRKKVLDNIKAALATGYVAMFGFSVYSSLGWDADVPYPTPRDTLDGGHAVLAVGYDDAHQCPNAGRGALRFRNSWGPGWGDCGYGWLPYDYVLNGLADDFWTCYKQDWVDTGAFK